MAVAELHAVVAAHPADRTARLVLADAVDEAGGDSARLRRLSGDGTTEDDFQEWLDGHVDDHEARVWFGEWLRERGDARGDGYVCLGRLDRRPTFYPADAAAGTPPWLFWWDSYPHARERSPDELPRDWNRGMTDDRADDRKYHHGAGFRTRRRAEDEAARAFARLPPARRAELLAVPGPPWCRHTGNGPAADEGGAP